jgi:catechol 2,3-dioxygenase-like lactoylglutathione lyase family enzyme
MVCMFDALSWDALDPHGLARFWGTLLGWPVAEDDEGYVEVRPLDDTGLVLRFRPTGRAKTSKNRTHLDLTSDSLFDQNERVALALSLGARHIDVGQRPEETHVVLADPEGNEFCVIEPGNAFLADCGLVGALAGDGSQEVGYFWRDALGWPLVWDQDLETAIRSPEGGPKLTWGGPPVAPKTGRNRLRFDIATPRDADRSGEAERLLALGATRPDAAQDDLAGVALVDPDGNEFCVLERRE